MAELSGRGMGESSLEKLWLTFQSEGTGLNCEKTTEVPTGSNHPGGA